MTDDWDSMIKYLITNGKESDVQANIQANISQMSDKRWLVTISLPNAMLDVDSLDDCISWADKYLDKSPFCYSYNDWNKWMFNDQLAAEQFVILFNLKWSSR